MSTEIRNVLVTVAIVLVSAFGTSVVHAARGPQIAQIQNQENLLRLSNEAEAARLQLLSEQQAVSGQVPVSRAGKTATSGQAALAAAGRAQQLAQAEAAVQAAQQAQAAAQAQALAQAQAQMRARLSRAS